MCGPVLAVCLPAIEDNETIMTISTTQSMRLVQFFFTHQKIFVKICIFTAKENNKRIDPALLDSEAKGSP